MILKGSQRGGARQLAAHLLRMDENDHVEVHEVRGFIADDLGGALHEAYAISRGTRCQQFLFSLSLSPPQQEPVPIDVFEKAIASIESKLGLDGQPRVVVFHEKKGRRHAHCVWSRIDADKMRAINLPHFKLKLRDMARTMFFEYGWTMPPGLANSAERDPRNFSRAEWQQAKRAEHDPAALKEAFQDCWAISDSRKAFAHALAARGLYLARGDRRGFVAVDVKGEVFAIARWTGLRTKAIEARLGDPDELPSVAETKVNIAELLTGMLGRHLAASEAAYREQRGFLRQRQTEMRDAQRRERARLREQQAARAEAEAQVRAARFRQGLRGLWDRLTGRLAHIRHENEGDAAKALARDLAESHALIQHQLRGRRIVKRELVAAQDALAVEREVLYREIAEQQQGGEPRRNPMPAGDDCGIGLRPMLFSASAPPAYHPRPLMPSTATPSSAYAPVPTG